MISEATSCVHEENRPNNRIEEVTAEIESNAELPPAAADCQTQYEVRKVRPCLLQPLYAQLSRNADVLTPD